MASREDWIGSTGQEWARHSTAIERLLGPAGAAGIAALDPRPGERILDLGCGAGSSTEALATATAPGGHVTGIDVSPDLIRAARERLDGRGGTSLLEADAERHPFPPGHFDALFSRFGMMFFDNPGHAFANLHGALRPGGRAVMVAWREPARNLWASVPMSFVADEMAGQSAGPAGPGPFAWAEPQSFLPVLEGAGFQDIRHETCEFSAEIGHGEGEGEDPVTRAVQFMSRIGPLAARMRGAPESARREAEAFLASRLARHVKDGVVRLLSSAWIITAER